MKIRVLELCNKLEYASKLQDFAMNFRKLKLLACLNALIVGDLLCTVKLFCAKFIKTRIKIKETTSAENNVSKNSFCAILDWKS